MMEKKLHSEISSLKSHYDNKLDDLEKKLERVISLLKSYYISKDADSGVDLKKKKKVEKKKVEEKEGTDVNIDKENIDVNKGEKSDVIFYNSFLKTIGAVVEKVSKVI